MACILYCALDIVRDHNNGNTLLIKLLDQPIHFMGGYRIQSGYRFVSKALCCWPPESSR